jgi:protein-L-isoaspartate(D-aspartate) O-methyltransferase
VIVSEHEFDTMRRAMVSSQLRTTAVSDPRVVAAMEYVARENFVPVDRRALAYVDVAVPLGEGRALNPPMATGRLLNEASVRASDHVLIVGAATGYSAAVMSILAKSVVALECDADLAKLAKVNLAALANVSVVSGALSHGWAKSAPYDVILIDGAVETVPAALLKQLTEGGRLATAIVENGVMRLAIGIKAGEGFGLNAFVEADAARLPGFEIPQAFRF